VEQKLIWSPKAISCLENIHKFISKDSVYYASHFVDRIVQIIENIPCFPRSGRMVPEYNDDNIREKIFRKYRIVYRLKESSIEIVAIVHGTRLLENIL